MGPKKGGGNRGGSKNPPKAPKAAKPAEEGDYIVFSNAKDKPGPQNADPKDPKRESSKGGAAGAAPADGQEQPKRPDTKKLIGGASWTGKLPVNVLAEHCQKQKWEKPEYTMVTSAVSRTQTPIILYSPI